VGTVKPKKTLAEYQSDDRRRIELTAIRFGLSEREKRILTAASDFLDMTYEVGKAKRYLTQVSLNPKKIDEAVDPRTQKNWKFFERMIERCEQLKANPRMFIRCCVWRTATEDPRWEVFPSMLGSDWAVSRYVAFSGELPPEKTDEDRKFDFLSTVRLGKNFLNIQLNRYPHARDIQGILRMILPGKIFPESVLWIFHGVVTVGWCAASRTFWKWIPSVQSDIADEYIPMERIFKCAQSLIASPDIMASLREVMNTDLISYQELKSLGL